MKRRRDPKDGPLGCVRISSGTWRGRRIPTPPGDDTRPLLGRVRKSLADILRPQLHGARVLDLFGGSGAVAFELLSNGAAEATIVELDPDTAALIRSTAATLGAAAQVRAANALEAVPRLATEGRFFDVIVVAPPYGRELQQAALRALEASWLLAPGGIVVLQREGAEPEATTRGRLTLERRRVYGRTVLEFYREGSG